MQSVNIVVRTTAEIISPLDPTITGLNARGIYRLFVDNDLLTERSWIWDPLTSCVDESIWIETSPGIEHTFTVEAAVNKTIKYSISSTHPFARQISHDTITFKLQ